MGLSAIGPEEEELMPTFAKCAHPTCQCPASEPAACEKHAVELPARVQKLWSAARAVLVEVESTGRATWTAQELRDALEPFEV